MIAKEMKISELINRWPETIDILFDFGLGCVGCPSAAFETLENGAKKHGLSDEDVDLLVETLNKLVKKLKVKKEKIKKKK